MVDPDQLHHIGDDMAHEYSAMVAAARTALTVNKGGILYTHGSKEKIIFSVYKIIFNNKSLDLIFHLPSLYISGWYNKNNERIVAKDWVITDGPSLPKPKGEIRLKSTFDYGNLGFQQNQDQNTRKVSMFDVSKALDALSDMALDQVEGKNWNTNKEYICNLCLGIAEAMRFNSARDNVIKGAEIGNISWNGSNATEQIKRSTNT